MSQWSKGEYAFASNPQQDDVAIIAKQLTTEVDEAGDTFATARALDLYKSDVMVSGIIATRTDVDIFKIFLQVGGKLQVTARPWMSKTNTKGNNLDVGLKVFNGSGSLLASDDPAAVATAQVAVDVSYGNFYIQVEGVSGGVYSDYGVLGQYDLEVTFDQRITLNPVPSCYDELEYNNRFSSATTVKLPFQRTLTICPLDLDYFAVDVCAGGTIAAAITFREDAKSNMRLILFDLDDALRPESQSSSKVLEMTNTGESGKQLFALISGGSAENYDYNLSITQSGACRPPTTPPTTPSPFYITTPGCQDDALEPNNRLATATPIGSLPFDRRELTICPGDSDYFDVDICAGGIVSVVVSFSHREGDLDMYMLYNGEVLYKSESNTDKELLRVTNSGVVSEQVHFRIFGYQTLTKASYSVYISQEGPCNPPTTTPTTPSPTTTVYITTTPSCQDDALEPNNRLTTATPVGSLPFARELTICPGDSDFFEVDICAGGSVAVAVSFSHNEGDLELHMLQNGEVQFKSESSTDNELLSLTNTGVGSAQVHFRIFGYRPLTTASYTV